MIIFKFFILLLLYIEQVKPQINCSNRYGYEFIKNGECKDIDSCTGAVLLGDCGDSKLVCCFEDKPITFPENKIITKKIFLNIVGNTTRNNFLYDFFSESMNLANIDNKYQAAAYLSQMIGETDYFRWMESLKPESDFNSLIGNEILGMGSNYRGRGAILLRGKLNYQLANIQLNKSIDYDLVMNPERAAFPSIAFKIGAWFWTQNAYVIKSAQPALKESLNFLADGTFLSFTHLTHSLTNSLNSLNVRANLNENILKELGVSNFTRGQGISCTSNNEIGYAVPICMKNFQKYCGCDISFEMESCPYGLNGDKKCRNSHLVKCCIEKCNAGLDLAILMDASGSIGTADFVREKNFVKSLISNLKIGRNETRLAIINFSSSSDIIIDFNSNQTIQSLNSIIDNIYYTGGGTDTADALKVTNDRIMNEAYGMRPINEDIPKVVIVITDGASNNYAETIYQANRLKSRGISIISVGVGSGINQQELNNMASSLSQVFLATNFNQILNLVSSLSKSTCEQPTILSFGNELISSVAKEYYKFFKLPLSNPSIKNVTIELKISTGNANLYYSFNNTNPKSPDDFLDPSLQKEKEHNYIEIPSFNRTIDSDTNKLYSKNVVSPKLYQIILPETNKVENIYLSVKGIEKINQFRIFIFN